MAPPVREHLLARGKLAERANSLLGKAWDKGWLPEPELDPDALWAIAAKPFGSNSKIAEYGGRSSDDAIDFRLRLEKLTTAASEEADLNPLGRAMAHGQLVRVIGNRLKLGAYWEKHPFPARGVDLAPPIIIIGHMRSGTTRIHKLFAADPAHSYTRYCDAWRPTPGNLTWRRIKGSLDLVMLEALNPWLQSIHPMASGEVEEELAWLAGALNHSIYESQWRIPSYSAFSEARDPMPIYSELNRILLTDAMARGVERKPRVMKAPQFSEDLTTLLFLFPDTRLVLADREHGAVHRSAVSLAANQMAIQSDNCKLAEIEALWQHKIALREKRIGAALNGWSGPITRLRFDDLNTDWEAEIRRAYRELQLPLTDEALTAMRKAMADNREGKHSIHSEQLARFAEQN
ncbi:MAG: sulfotransferase [Pseudomonadota bacterium]